MSKNIFNERIPFRMFIMPCCQHQLCWVNPRMPSYCPACGEAVYAKLKSGEHTMVTDDGAWLKVDAKYRHIISHGGAP